jgi:hypothetical protein
MSMFQVMVVTTQVEVEQDRPVVVKRAPAAEAERLRREGERLQRARHPGVVPVLHSGPDGGGWVLRTAHAGRSVASLGALPVAQVAGLVAGVATTLADLHHLGVVHGRLDASHVLVGEEGRPVLCGLGDGVPAARPEADVAALGALLVQLLGTDDAGEPIPDRRWRRHRSWAGWDRRALLLLADQAAADEPTRRPTARRLATAIAEAVPGTASAPVPASRPDELDPPDPIERLRATATLLPPRAGVSRRTRALAAAGVLLVGLGLHRLTVDEPHAPPAAPTTPPDVRTAAPVVDSVLEVDGRRYRIGQAGDALLVDDWACDGEPTPALLRPATGEVFVFPRWVDAGTLAVESVQRVVGARTLRSERTDGGCPALTVRTGDGAVIPVLEAAR